MILELIANRSVPERGSAASSEVLLTWWYATWAVYLMVTTYTTSYTAERLRLCLSLDTYSDFLEATCRILVGV